MPAFPKPEEWVHLALAWDENRGIRFYVNGKFVAEAAATGMFNATLDQFGPHSRAINPVQVQSAYNFDRGGDIDEIRIYDRMLSDDNIAALAHNQTPRDIPALARNLSSQDWQQEWWFRYGWNRPGDVPPPLAERYTTVRKVEIHDAYDLKRWWWRATDGIRETTWPGVYNRSRLPGRNDYFQLPDWDCYSLSGKAITFFMPEEPWNHLEISGGAWGNMSLLSFDVEKRGGCRKEPLRAAQRPGEDIPPSRRRPSPARRSASPTWSRRRPLASWRPITCTPATSPPASRNCDTG